ncbi:MAG: lipid kinase YegS [Planctomycetota bacterium]|nr:MAG: lipid kinase YegS [Planctomycetota bacterium]REJ96223.1 MAG: lipid kinase YegS [Planctomycetota bacterium]REK24461.1 MAG: lipid kinase YegS [Planctomycetota bacterium]REK38650.1 MAG: lipid kinase YegS [Planctomycetota bacterium]
MMRLILHGLRADEPLIRDAVRRLRSEGHAVEVRVTWEDGDAHRLALEAVQAGAETVVAGGGDGTINEVCNALLETDRANDVVFGVLPLGTANDFATAAGIPTDDPYAALRIVVERPPTRIDVGRVNDRHFVNVVSGGYGAEVTTATDPSLKRVLGGFAYFLTGLTNMDASGPRHLRLQGPGLEWEGDLLAFAVCNGRLAGGGFHVGPHAILNDGLLDLMILPDLPFSEWPHILHEFRTGETGEPPEEVIYRQLPELTIEAPDSLQINLDGGPIFGTRFEFSVAPQQLQMTLPEGSPLVKTP